MNVNVGRIATAIAQANEMLNGWENDPITLHYGMDIVAVNVIDQLQVILKYRLRDEFEITPREAMRLIELRTSPRWAYFNLGYQLIA